MLHFTYDGAIALAVLDFLVNAVAVWLCAELLPKPWRDRIVRPVPLLVLAIITEILEYLLTHALGIL